MTEHNRRPPTRGKPSMQEFARLVADGATARDRFGNPLAKGQLVLYDPDVDVMYQITDIVPVMDPRLPNPCVRITIEAKVPLTLAINQVWDRITAVGWAKDAAEAILAAKQAAADNGAGGPQGLVEPPPPGDDPDAEQRVREAEQRVKDLLSGADMPPDDPPTDPTKGPDDGSSDPQK